MLRQVCGHNPCLFVCHLIVFVCMYACVNVIAEAKKLSLYSPFAHNVTVSYDVCNFGPVSISQKYDMPYFQIEQLEVKVQQGEEINADQQDKLQRKGDVLEQLEKLQ